MSKTAIIVKIPCAPGQKEEVAAALAKMFDQVESEAGTELYILHDDAGEPDTLWMYECYSDSDAFQAHASSEAMLALFGTLGGDLVAGAPVMSMVTPRQAKGLDL